MLINEKRFPEWGKEDIFFLLDNDVYKENEIIDYKRNFAFFESKDKNSKINKKNEFRHDVCSFANSKGGYLFFGIAEEEGIVNEIHGLLDINTDALEITLKDLISSIIPVPPNYKLIDIDIGNNKKVIVIKIYEGDFKPYVCKVNHDFRFFMRRGNGKIAMNYEEVKQQFLQNSLMSEAIDEFRERRKILAINKEGIAASMRSSSFALVHIIPRDSLTNKYRIYTKSDLYETGREYKNLFRENASGREMPNVDGLGFSYHEVSPDMDEYLQLFKNGIIEKYYTLRRKKRTEKGPDCIFVEKLCERILNLVKESVRYISRIGISESLFLTTSIYNCKGTSTNWGHFDDYYGFVDRDEVKCIVFEIKDIRNTDVLNQLLENMFMDLCFSLGNMDTKFINKLFM